VNIKNYKKIQKLMTENNRKTYTKQQVEKATLDYFKGDKLARDVWIRKYCLKDEQSYYELTPDDMHHRIAEELARIEAKYPNPLSEEQIYNTLKNFKRIVPQGSPMSGIGNNNQVVSLSNCFVIGNDGKSDSYGGILKIDQEQIQLMKRRGGVGHDLSHIRPNGSPVKNSAITSTGIVPFMERYSNSTKEVAQDGRRGALMLSVNVKHPDAENFIDAKMTEGMVTGANVSVKLTDDFMKAALSGNSFLQQYPIESKDPKYTKEIDAEKLWKKIIHNAWQYAEPGILFWDAVQRESIPDCYQDFGFKTVSTNPCFPSSEYLLTNNGYVKFGDLYDSKVKNTVVCDSRISYVDDGEEKPENWKIDNTKLGTINREASNVFLTQVSAEVMEITTSKGFRLKSTLDHHIATTEGMVEAQYLTPNHKILIPTPNNDGSIIGLLPNTIDEHVAMLVGLVMGDGCFDESKPRVHLDFWGDDSKRITKIVCDSIDILHEHFGVRNNIKNRELSKYFITYSNDIDKTRISSPWLSQIFSEYGYSYENKHVVPEFIMNNSSSNVGKYYIAAMFYCDGSVQGSNESGYTIRLAQSNEKLLQNIQMIMQSNGILGGIYKRRDSKMTSFPDGKNDYKDYQTKIQYELITINGGLVEYRKKIGFLGDDTKETKMNVEHNFRDMGNFVDNIIEINTCDKEPVFCLKEDIGRNIIVNGISTRRCGEIPLCPYDSCRLLAINLFGYVSNPFTPNAIFHWELFKQDVMIAMRYMDDIIDLELEKIDAILEKIKADPEDEFIKLYEINLWEKIKEKTQQGRRTGLGVTAEGDMLAGMGLRYGNDDGTDFSEKVHETLKLAAYRSSVVMAQERGAFPIYNSSNELGNPFIERISKKDPDLFADMVTYGRRNIALLTIAPTGTVSLMTQTTSGCEPVFLPVYKRRRKINPQEKDVRIDFVDDEGIAWMEYQVFHHNFELWLDINGYDIDVVKTMSDEQVREIVKKSPYYKATSADVDWVKKVEMQGRLQKHIDHSISVTVNLPEHIDEETVAKVYETGWRSGCKGITVYREGSRSGVLVTNEKKVETPEEVHAPKRPKRLKGEIHRFQNNLEKWIAVVGLKDGRPYEVFTGKYENGLSNLPTNLKDCEVVKNIIEVDGKRIKRYDIEYVDNKGEKHVHTGLNHAFNPVYWNYAKLISAVLRHKMPLVFVHQIIDSLTFGDDHINTWKNGVGRVIKRYIKDGEKGKGVCPDCGSEHLEYKEGCLVCMACGSSKCS